MEKWKAIKDYEGYYEVSDQGNVRSLDRIIQYPDGHKQCIKGKMLNLTLTKWGYPQVKLCKNHYEKRKHVHDLVAEAFIFNPNNLTEVNHKDHNKTNNNVKNLEWITHKDNMKDMAIFTSRYRNQNNLICPICGNSKSFKANMCRNCYNAKSATSNRPSKDMLQKQISKGLHYMEIGRLYKVSDNCVKKWCQFYDIKLPVFTRKPQKDILMQQLQTNTKDKIAELYNTSKALVNSWIKDYNIVEQQLITILCVEDDKTFDNFENAYLYANIKSSKTSLITFKDNLQRSNRTGKQYYKYTWRITKEYKYFYK